MVATDKKTEFSDVLVLLPGLMGSVLERDGRVLWGTSKRHILRVLWRRGAPIKELLLQRDSPEDEPVDDIVATRLIDDVQIIPGWWKIDGYSGIRAALQKRLTVTPGKNYFEFPYDWRRDIRSTSKRLRRLALRWLEDWRESSGNKDAQLVLIGHSMGGLVSRYFLECLGGRDYTRSLFTLGTPHRGAVASYARLVNGFTLKLGPLRFDLAEFARSVTSAYQLSAVWPSLDMGDGTLRRFAEVTGLPHVDTARAKDALAFHREIAARFIGPGGALRRVDHGYKLVPIVGTRQKTYASAVLRDGEITQLNTLGGKEVDGDGTVSRLSATPWEMSQDGDEVFVATKHAALQNSEAVQHHIDGVLSNVGLDLLSAFDEPVTLGLEIEDIFSVGEPVSLTLTPSEDPGPLDIELVSQADGEVVHHSTVGGSKLADAIELPPLAEGVYRVRVRGGDGVSPVEDLFTVFDTAADEAG